MNQTLGKTVVLLMMVALITIMVIFLLNPLVVQLNIPQSKIIEITNQVIDIEEVSDGDIIYSLQGSSQK
jgi:hypothetical protein